ncbi:hypothetical protein WDU99_01725 [Microbacterium sp. Mu-80]|uniref:Uncharacterized protein n=1 Tax=Microbacterium bandirmense TaxID=3122050 RepID=A0ABU8L7S0_9MICO
MTMAHKTIRDYLHDQGIDDDDITRAGAVLDQAKAEVDHLLEHAIVLTETRSPDQAIAAARAIRAHFASTRQDQYAIATMLLSRAGQLASTVMRQAEEIDNLKAQIEKHASGRSTWWRR